MGHADYRFRTRLTNLAHAALTTRVQICAGKRNQDNQDRHHDFADVSASSADPWPLHQGDDTRDLSQAARLSSIQGHIELETDRLVAEGLSAEDARAAAHRMFGNVALVKEQFFETNRWMWLEHGLQDLRYAARGLRHNPAFLATSVTTLAVALGLVTLAFTLFNAYVLRPYAVRDPYSLYEIGWRTPARLGDTFRWRGLQPAVLTAP